MADSSKEDRKNLEQELSFWHAFAKNAKGVWAELFTKAAAFNNPAVVGAPAFVQASTVDAATQSESSAMLGRWADYVADHLGCSRPSGQEGLRKNAGIDSSFRLPTLPGVPIPGNLACAHSSPHTLCCRPWVWPHQLDRAISLSQSDIPKAATDLSFHDHTVIAEMFADTNPKLAALITGKKTPLGQIHFAAGSAQADLASRVASVTTLFDVVISADAAVRSAADVQGYVPGSSTRQQRSTHSQKTTLQLPFCCLEDAMAPVPQANGVHQLLASSLSLRNPATVTEVDEVVLLDAGLDRIATTADALAWEETYWQWIVGTNSRIQTVLGHLRANTDVKVHISVGTPNQSPSQGAADRSSSTVGEWYSPATASGNGVVALGTWSVPDFRDFRVQTLILLGIDQSRIVTGNIRAKIAHIPDFSSCELPSMTGFRLARDFWRSLLHAPPVQAFLDPNSRKKNEVSCDQKNEEEDRLIRKYQLLQRFVGKDRVSEGRAHAVTTALAVAPKRRRLQVLIARGGAGHDIENYEQLLLALRDALPQADFLEYRDDAYASGSSALQGMDGGSLWTGTTAEMPDRRGDGTDRGSNAAEAFDPKRSSVLAGMRLFSRADVVITTRIPGFAHIMASRPGVCVIELVRPGDASLRITATSVFAGVSEHHHYLLRPANTTSASLDAAHADAKTFSFSAGARNNDASGSAGSKSSSLRDYTYVDVHRVVDTAYRCTSVQKYRMRPICENLQ
jgi:hypothetical protein